ncbi:Uncharacterised protein [Vibrio cholerae]|nr:Uncharacterised protein [Vibrio cholerae]
MASKALVCLLWVGVITVSPVTTETPLLAR